MNSSILHFAKWICRQLTRPEFDSLAVIFQEVQSGSREDFVFKEEKPSPNYRDFRQEPVQPLREPPAGKPVLGLDDWKDRLAPGIGARRVRPGHPFAPRVPSTAAAKYAGAAQLSLPQRWTEGHAVQMQGLLASRHDRAPSAHIRLRPFCPHWASPTNGKRPGRKPPTSVAMTNAASIWRTRQVDSRKRRRGKPTGMIRTTSCATSTASTT